MALNSNRTSSTNQEKKVNVIIPKQYGKPKHTVLTTGDRKEPQ